MFSDVCDGHHVEVIVLRGDTAACNRAIMQHWRNDHPEARADYEAQKYRHCRSRRDYLRRKDNYITTPSCGYPASALWRAEPLRAIVVPGPAVVAPPSRATSGRLSRSSPVAAIA